MSETSAIPQTTSGDTHACDCPACGETITDLWDSSDLRKGTEIDCDCGKTLVVSKLTVEHDLGLLWDLMQAAQAVVSWDNDVINHPVRPELLKKLEDARDEVNRADWDDLTLELDVKPCKTHEWVAPKSNHITWSGFKVCKGCGTLKAPAKEKTTT